jgi:hypothetical protein
MAILMHKDIYLSINMIISFRNIFDYKVASHKFKLNLNNNINYIFTSFFVFIIKFEMNNHHFLQSDSSETERNIIQRNQKLFTSKNFYITITIGILVFIYSMVFMLLYVFREKNSYK